MKSNIEHKNNRRKTKMSLKIKKEIKKLTKVWLESLSNKKKMKSKKSVNKFINTLKKNCKLKTK